MRNKRKNLKTNDFVMYIRLLIKKTIANKKQIIFSEWNFLVKRSHVNKLADRWWVHHVLWSLNGYDLICTVDEPDFEDKEL